MHARRNCAFVWAGAADLMHALDVMLWGEAQGRWNVAQHTRCTCMHGAGLYAVPCNCGCGGRRQWGYVGPALVGEERSCWQERVSPRHSWLPADHP